MELMCGGAQVELELVEEGRQAIVEPATCPSCSSPTSRNCRGKLGAVTYCTNQRCHAAVFGKIDHWIGTSKKCVGILDIGDTMIEALWKLGVLTDPADLYTLTPDMLKDVVLTKGGKIGLSRATKIVANITAKKQLPLHTFLGSLGIDLLGRRRVEIIREAAGGQLDKLEDWLDLNKMGTLVIPGLGDTIRSSIVAGIEDCMPTIKRLLANGVTILYDAEPVPTETSEAGDEPATTKPFAELSFCFTGTRDHLDDVIRLGGTIKSGVSKGLDYLVQKDALSVSNKTKKAEEYGTQIIGIDYLNRAIKGEVALQKAVQPVAV